MIHTASPFVLADQIDNRLILLDPAIQGTTNLLTSILQHNPKCKRVVITSSFASILNPDTGLRPGYTYSELDWNPTTYEEAVHATGVIAYYASKTLAERAAWDFMEKHTSANSTSCPAFSLATVCCPMVYGPIEHHTRLNTLNASTADIYRLINGSEKSVPETKFYAWVDVRDAAEAHVRALEAPRRPAGVEDRFLVAAGGYSYTEVCKIIQKRFPHLVNTGLTPNPAGAPLPPPHYSVDSGKSVRELGMQYRPLETCIVELVNSLLKLRVDEEGEEERAPVSVTDVRTGREHRSHSLAGTGLTVCECEGNMGVCSCSPSTCACRGCARKSLSNPTARVAQHGPKPGMGAVPKEWKEVGDLGVSGLGQDDKPSGAVCDCVDSTACGKATTDSKARNDDDDDDDASPAPVAPGHSTAPYHATRHSSLSATAAPFVPMLYAAPETMAPLIVPDTSVSSFAAPNPTALAPVISYVPAPSTATDTSDITPFPLVAQPSLSPPPPRYYSRNYSGPPPSAPPSAPADTRGRRQARARASPAPRHVPAAAMRGMCASARCRRIGLSVRVRRAKKVRGGVRASPGAWDVSTRWRRGRRLR